MTWEELLQASVTGLPQVIWNGKTGRITAIKDNGDYKGCSARFLNNYDEWFWAETGTDKRKKYMSELTLYIIKN